MLRIGLILLAISVTASLTAHAQAPAGGGGAAGGNTGGGNNNGVDQQQQQQQQQQMRMEQPIFASGNVILASGGAPAEPIRIYRVCGVQKTDAGYTDSKGRYSFQVGYGFQDASIAGAEKGEKGWGFGIGVGGACTLQADAPGYRSNVISAGGTIILTPLGETQGSVISVTSLAAPKKARASFFKAMKELDKGPSANLGKAMENLQKAVDEYPEYAAAWAKLGQVKADSGDPDGAIVALEKSVQLDERYLLPYDALVRLYMGKGDWDHATELTKFVLGINPADTAMRWYRAVCSYETGHDDEAMSLIGEVVKDPEAAKQFPQTQRIMGLIYAKRGEYAEAAAAYNRYLEWDPNGQAVAAVKKQLNEWEALGVI